MATRAHLLPVNTKSDKILNLYNQSVNLQFDKKNINPLYLTTMIQSLRFFLILSLLLFNSLFATIHAQPDEQFNSSDIHQAIKKLNILGSVLYIAAHPDDENTRLITYFTKDKLYNTGYLSLTRGDGGQNLIGAELNELLGIIRTQELLEARKIDGGKQFFSRAKDFGFSKNPDETFDIWNREQVLADMVWVVRTFRPDVMITRFNTEPGRTHGHHTASAILAVEAFDAAADPSRFPEQLKYVDVWQAKRLLWNTNSWFYGSEKEFKTDSLIKIDVGAYNKLLGESYTEIAAESRSMHKSQGFGSSGTRGSSMEYLEHTKGPKVKKNIFEDIDLSWSRVPGGAKAGKILQKVYTNFNPENPAAAVDGLLEARIVLLGLPDTYWKKVKLQELEEVIKACLGLWTEAVASDYSAVPGQAVKVNIELVNRSSIPVAINKITYLPAIKDTVLHIPLKENIAHIHSTLIPLPETLSYTQPYWLIKEGTKGMFTVGDQKLIGLPENLPAIEVEFTATVKGKNITFRTPLVYKKTDPVKGEQYRPFEITPPLFINTSEDLLMFADDKPTTLPVKIKSGIENVSGTLYAALPEGWRAEPSSVAFNLENKGSELNTSFNIYPSSSAMTGEVKLLAVVNKDTVDSGVLTINYDHIPAQTLFPEASVKVVKLDLKKQGEKIGYIMGAGDEVPTSLGQIGYKVFILEEEAVTEETLKNFDAVVIGIRAFNTQERLKFIHPALLSYVKSGGTLVSQYNTLPPRFLGGKMMTDSIGPYPFTISRDRVTKEDAPVRMLKPEHELLTTPNKITDKDFENWVQERGLYFPNEWSKEYETILSSNDPDETPKDGGILYAQYGKGIFIYTSYSWFRQLPAGVPGAYRLFVNLISAGNGK